MKPIERTISFLLLFSFFCSFFSGTSSAQTSDVPCAGCEKLESAGFPPSFCKRLCTLQRLHPAWRIEPLCVTAIAQSEHAENKYDFSFVTEAETVPEERNLVPLGDAYTPYAKSFAKAYDSGLYPASKEAVEYFLDARNFLSEQGIFQFLDFSFSVANQKECVLAALQNAPGYAPLVCDGILEAGEKTGVLPLYLAVLLYREQGRDGSPLLWGNAGDVLLEYYRNRTQTQGQRQVLAPQDGISEEELKSLNGCFNPFHANTSGTGRFAVVLAGARHAQDRGWRDLRTGLCGGAEKIQKEYLERYQNTPYLQKWNVDARSRTDTGQSRNFWGQYMQNITGAVAMGNQFYTLLKDAGLLDTDFHFIIPVYENMPSDPAPDPAEGKCPLTRRDDSAEVFHKAVAEENKGACFAQQINAPPPSAAEERRPLAPFSESAQNGVPGSIAGGAALVGIALYTFCKRKKLPPPSGGGKRG